MIKRVSALIFALTLALCMGVSVFAFQPNENSFLPTIGGWQATTSNTNYTTQWRPAVCRECGTSGYEIELSDAPSRPGDIIAITSASPNTLTEHSDCGIVYATQLDEPHSADAHKPGVFFSDFFGGVSSVLFTVNSHNTTPFRCVYGGIQKLSADGGISPLWERLSPVYRENLQYRSQCALYGFTTLSVPLYADEVETYIDSVGENGYNQGLINGTENSNSYLFIGEVIDSVSSTILNALYDIDVLGISLLHLVYLVVAVGIITLILKIVRG